MKSAMHWLLAAVLCIGMTVAASATELPQRSLLLDIPSMRYDTVSSASITEVLTNVAEQAKAEVEKNEALLGGSAAPSFDPAPVLDSGGYYSTLLQYLLGR